MSEMHGKLTFYQPIYNFTLYPYNSSNSKSTRKRIFPSISDMGSFRVIKVSPTDKK
jgi:hypothetical protein